ncbi:MAG: hypothetical protein IKY91_00660, partial [Akkermansia sp.]|nr:hypothetical protein [Akkermansia sp.]
MPLGHGAASVHHQLTTIYVKYNEIAVAARVTCRVMIDMSVNRGNASIEVNRAGPVSPTTKRQ